MGDQILDRITGEQGAHQAPVPKTEAQQPRARGAAQLVVKCRQPLPSNGQPVKTVLKDMRQAGSLKLLFPRTASKALQVVQVNTAGGVTGGDEFETTAHVEAGGALSLTTQAAERAYRAQPGEQGRITTTLSADQDAQLHWVPQETILFEGCNLARRLQIDLEAGAEAVVAETLVFGRAAMGEVLTRASLTDSIAINRQGAPLFRDRFDLSADLPARLSARWGLNGAGALANVIVAGRRAAGLLECARAELARAQLDKSAGASLLADDLLLIRILAPDSHEMRKATIPILQAALGEALPRPWKI